MGTELREVYDLFLQLVTDYRLIQLLDSSSEDFETYVEAWLKMAIFEFNVCNQTLIYDSYTKTFLEQLETNNQVVLANLMVKQWMKKNVSDVTQMNLHVTDRDFKVFSEAQNLREKINYLNIITENCSQMLIDYSYRENTDWTNWSNQIFGE